MFGEGRHNLRQVMNNIATLLPYRLVATLDRLSLDEVVELLPPPVPTRNQASPSLSPRSKTWSCADGHARFSIARGIPQRIDGGDGPVIGPGAVAGMAPEDELGV